MAKTPHFHRREQRFDPWPNKLRPNKQPGVHTTPRPQKEKNSEPRQKMSHVSQDPHGVQTHRAMDPVRPPKGSKMNL